MRIISKQKDYYDIGQVNYEPEPVYVREERQLNIKVKNKWFGDGFYLGAIGFCGTVCPMIYSWSDEKYLTFFEKPVVKISRRCWWDIENYNNDWETVCEPLKGIFESQKCPIFTFMNDAITINPLLKHLHFYRIFNAAAAYYEIARFLSNIAQPEKPIPVVSDEIMVGIKGFDKYSFRKDKAAKP